ncbi:hypothetical protein KI387_027683, partial [Taxus chinensis]
TELTTAERELDQNTNFDWNRIQESGQDSEALFGPGYTGLINLGNSCYLASIMQTVFSTRDFILRYFKDQKLNEAFERGPADPTVELNMQLIKLGHGMLSGKYSSPVQEDNEEISENMTSKPVSSCSSILHLDDFAVILDFQVFAGFMIVGQKKFNNQKNKQEGISPRMFKTLIGTGHPEFSSTRQQLSSLDLSFSNNPPTALPHSLTQMSMPNQTNDRARPRRTVFLSSNLLVFDVAALSRLHKSPCSFSCDSARHFLVLVSRRTSTNFNEYLFPCKSSANFELEAKNSLNLALASLHVGLTSLSRLASLTGLVGLTQSAEFSSKNCPGGLGRRSTSLCQDLPSLDSLDALEFFLHLLDKVEQNNAGNPQSDPSRCFKFFVEDRILCTSGKVSYNKRVDNVLSLNIPLDAATNKGEVVAFQKKKAERELAGEKLKDEEIVRPRVPLSACLESFAAPEEVHEFYSTAMKSKTTAIKTARLATFPDYLVLHMRKFVMEAGWVPKKLDVFIDVPDTIDINHLRSKGLQHGEELLPENDDGQDSGQRGPSADEAIVSQLASMGFPRLHCEKAAINTSNSGVEDAMNWLLSHMDDADIDAPISAGLPNSPEPIDEGSLNTLVSFGFDTDISRKALRASGGDIARATEWIFTQPTGTSAMDVSSSGASTSEQALTDGEGNPNVVSNAQTEYKLMGFVSHIGTSTQCGHYVAHIVKEGRWVIFNDCKVAVSSDPPKDMGYLYFFERAN